MPLLLKHYEPSFAPSCCTAEVYCLLHDQDGNALKDNGGGVLTLQTFTGSNLDFAIALAEDGNRTKCYKNELADISFELADSAQGEHYDLEIWHRAAPPATNRAADTLLAVQQIVVESKRIVNARLDTAEEDRLAKWEVKTTVTYDQDTNTVYVIAWLERNGELSIATGANISCTFLWYKTDGTEIANVEHTTYMTGLSGVFAFSIADIDLDPDRATPAVVTIKDDDGTDHVGVSGLATWD